MMLLITPNCYGDFVDKLAEMHRLRHRVFRQRLNWDVQVSGKMEADEFDVLRPVHFAASVNGWTDSGMRSASAVNRPNDA